QIRGAVSRAEAVRRSPRRDRRRAPPRAPAAAVASPSDRPDLRGALADARPLPAPGASRPLACPPRPGPPGTARTRTRLDLPPTQRYPLPARNHPSPRPRPRTRLTRAQTSRRQKPPRSDPLPQTTPRPRRLPDPQNDSRLDIGATLAQASASMEPAGTVASSR